MCLRVTSRKIDIVIFYYKIDRKRIHIIHYLVPTYRRTRKQMFAVDGTSYPGKIVIGHLSQTK